MPGSILTSYRETLAAINKDELVRILEATAALKDAARRLESEKAALIRQPQPAPLRRATITNAPRS